MNTTTPPVRVSFPTLFTPRAIEPGATPKYGIVLMFGKNNDEHKTCLRELLANAQAVFNAEWPDPKDPNTPRIPLVGHDKSPIKDGDKALNNQGVPMKEKNPEYAGHFIVRAGSTRRPIVVDKGKAEVLEYTKVYGGCYCKVNINPYAYDTKGNKGVTFGLNGVQFWAEGESFGGGRPPLDDMFDADRASQDSSADDDPFAGGASDGRVTGKVGVTTVLGPNDDMPF